MTTSQTSAEPLPLDPATFNTMLRSTVEALPPPPRATAEARAQQREAAFLAIAALHPRDPLEAMDAARIVALHFHAMYDLGCAIQPTVTNELQLRCQARAQALGRQSDKMRADYLYRQESEPARRPAGLPASAAVAPEPQPQPQPRRSPSRQRKPPRPTQRRRRPRPRPGQNPHPPRARRPPPRRHGPPRRPSPPRGVVTPSPSTMPRSSSFSPSSTPAWRPPPPPSQRDGRRYPMHREGTHPHRSAA